MRKVLPASIAALLSVLFASVSLHAAASWTLFGLKDQKINVILPMTGFGGNALMVGTDKGIWWYQSGAWDTAWTGLPVHDMIATPTGEPLAVAGNNSDSDGVYLGKITGIAKTAVGGPGMNTWWGFTFQQRHPYPTAMAFGALDGTCAGRVYVGNYDGIASGLLCNRAVGELTALPGPAHPFGLFCTSMMVYSENGMLYAGGNNYHRNASIAAPQDTPWLMKGITEPIRFKKLSVTSLVELHTEKGILLEDGIAADFRDVKLIAVATIDSGIQLLDGDYLYEALSSPVQNEPVVSIVPFNKIRTHMGFTLTMLAAATASGVFIQCSPDSVCEWREVGDLPKPPNCLAQFNGTTLWAGTDSGVYRYDYSTEVRQGTVSMAPSTMHVSAFRKGQGSIRFDFGDIDKAGYSLHVFDLRGRCVASDVIVGKRTAVTGVGRGMVLYRVMSGGRIVASDRVMCH